jgi:hypothetical protein
MEFNLPKVNFILETRDISTSNVIANYPVSNTKGSVNQSRTSMTWNAINMRNILGNLYDKYELFNIELVGFSAYQVLSNFGVTDNDRNVIFKMSGLDWVYNTYDTNTFNTTNQAIVGCQRFATQTNVFNASNTRRMTSTFRKNQIVNITITLNTIMGTLPNMNPNTVFPSMNFGFIITPVS